jgi:hypothetical protein
MSKWVCYICSFYLFIIHLQWSENYIYLKPIYWTVCLHISLHLPSPVYNYFCWLGWKINSGKSIALLYGRVGSTLISGGRTKHFFTWIKLS